MMLRALVLAVALAPAARADCEVCKKKHVKEIKSCGAFWTPSKYVGEFAKREAPAPTPRPTPAPVQPCSDSTTGCDYDSWYGYNCYTYDNYGRDCSYYDSNSYECGWYDWGYFKASAQCCACGGGTSWRRLGEAEDEAKDRRFLTHDDNDEEDDWTDSRSRCHKDVCCAAHESDCCEADVGAITAFTFALLALVICCVVACSCAACKDCQAGQKSNRRYVVLGFLAFLCAGMQCIAMLRGPLWARTVYHIEITDDAYEQNGYGDDREWTGECVSDTSTTDSNGNSCSYYDEGYDYYCGNYDDSNFNANDMCCACGGGSRDNQWKSGWTEEADLWLWVYKDNSHTEKYVIKEDKVKNCAWTKDKDWDDDDDYPWDDDDDWNGDDARPYGDPRSCKLVSQAAITARYTTGIACLLMAPCALLMLLVACGCRFRCCCPGCPDDATPRIFMTLAVILAVGGLIAIGGAANFSDQYLKGIESWEKHTEKGDDWRDDEYGRTWSGGQDRDVDMESVSCHWGCAFSILSGLFSLLVGVATVCLGMLRPVKQTKGLFNPPATPVPPLGVKHTCAKPGCKKAAKHTCSVCESVYYCSPQHQLDHWPAHKQECSAATRAAPNPPATPLPPKSPARKAVCAMPGCSKAAAHMCSACESVYYCSAEHQMSHWPTHKAACRPSATDSRQPAATAPPQSGSSRGLGRFGWRAPAPAPATDAAGEFEPEA